MNVSIIIVNYNTRDLTLQCLNSIYEKTEDLFFEIIVVDNNSTDDSVESIEKKYPEVLLIKSPENLGFGRANNLGMEHAKGEYIFLLNSDTLLINNAIKLLYDYAEGHDKRAFYGCWLEDQFGNYINSGNSIHTINSLLWNLFKSYIPWRHEGDRKVFYSDKLCYKIGYVSGADMFFHHTVYEETKGFDPHFFMYSEEVEWQRRASKHGIYSYLLNTPRIYHLCGGSQKIESPSFNVARFRRLMTSRYYYIRKEYNNFQYIYYRVLNALLYLPKLLLGKSRSFAAVKILFELI
jgi:GT2 family glycosyltransferase